jgi:hypothetical protein
MHRFWEVVCFASTPLQGLAALWYLGKEYWDWMRLRKAGQVKQPFVLHRPRLFLALILGAFIAAGFGFWLVFHPPVQTQAQSAPPSAAVPTLAPAPVPAVPPKTTAPIKPKSPSVNKPDAPSKPKKDGGTTAEQGGIGNQQAVQGGTGNQQAVNGDGSLVQQNSGGVNVQQGTTGDNSPITNSPITINAPKDILDKEMASLVEYLSGAPQKAPILINADQISGKDPFPDKFYDALRNAGWPMVRPGVDRMVGLGPPGKPFRGALVVIKGEPTNGETINTDPSDPLTYIGMALANRCKVPILLKREPGQPEGQIAIVFEGGFPN